MRDILFTGKRKDNGEWVEGYLGVFGDATQIFVPFTDEEIKENQGRFLSAINGVWHIVDPETVGQYTGLTDKNGTTIFEGNILADNPDGSITNVFEIFWHEELAGFMLDDGLNLCCTNEWLESDESNQILLEVIGNIYDNPELLKSQKEV